MTVLSALIDVGTALEETAGLLQYVLVFVFAAIPVVEVLVVVPIAIGLGLDPIATGVAAFAGNIGSVYVLVLSYRRIADWWSGSEDAETVPSDQYAKTRRLWDRYGLPGLAFGGPVLTGVHIAALVALLAGSRSRAVAAWMTIGIAAWTLALVVGSAFGLSVLGLA